METIYNKVDELILYQGKGIDGLTDCPNPEGMEIIAENTRRAIEIQKRSQPIKHVEYNEVGLK